MKPLHHRLLSLSLLGALAFAAAGTVTGCVAQSGDETTESSAKPLDGVAGDPNDPNGGTAPFSGVGLEVDPSTTPPKPTPEQKQAVPDPIPWHDDVVPDPIPWVTSAPNAK